MAFSARLPYTRNFLPRLLTRMFSSFAGKGSTDYVVSDVDQSIFQQDGIVCLRGVFSQEELDCASKGIEASLQSPSGHEDYLQEENSKGFYFNDMVNWKKIAELQRFVLHSSAARIAGELMRSKRSVFFHDHTFIKTGMSSRPVPWHQDQPYYFVNGGQTCSLWIPVTPVKHGSLAFVKGSHKKDWYMPIKFGTLKPYETKKELDRHYAPASSLVPEKSEITSWDLEPGDCLAFNFSCLHGSEGHPTDIDRRVLSARWVGDDAVYADRAWECSPSSDWFEEDFKVGDHLYKYSDSFPTLWVDDQSN